MDAQSQFAAEVIRAGAGTLAGFAATELVESSPDLATRYGRRAHAAWKGEFEQILVDLAASLGAESPSLFATQVMWLRDAFAARSSDDDLTPALAALDRTLQAQLPEPARRPTAAVMSDAMSALAKPTRDVVEPSDASLTGAYLLRILEGDRRAAMQLILDALARGETTVEDVYGGVLIEAQRRIGDLWHGAEINVAEEHFASTTTQMLMAVVAHQAEKAAPNGKTVLAASVAGDAHDIGVRAAADLFEIAGWRPIFLGADAPVVDLAQGVIDFDVDLLVLGASRPAHLREVHVTINAVKQAAKIPVIVGGGAFGDDADLARRHGADALATTPADAVEQAAKLV